MIKAVSSDRNQHPESMESVSTLWLAANKVGYKKIVPDVASNFIYSEINEVCNKLWQNINSKSALVKITVLR